MAVNQLFYALLTELAIHELVIHYTGLSKPGLPGYTGVWEQQYLRYYRQLPVSLQWPERELNRLQQAMFWRDLRRNLISFRWSEQERRLSVLGQRLF